jgi:Holliday junction resolvasome RuvABC endonuclease subunit
MTIVVGVDPAAARLDAVVLFPNGEWVLHTRAMPRDIVERCVTAQRWLENIIRTYQRYGPVAVGIEEPVVGRPGRAGANGTLPTAKVNGALLAASARAGAQTLPINNMTWKRKIVGKGNAKKPVINLWVKTHWPALWIEAKGRQDSCDAACIALEVERVLKFRKKVDALRQRVAAKGKR